jgi:hypothetical protein
MYMYIVHAVVLAKMVLRCSLDAGGVAICERSRVRLPVETSIYFVFKY